MNGAQRRELIVDAARTLLSERPYDEVAIGEIATRAGVARTVLYDHFPSKEALVLSFVSDEVTALIAVLTDRVSQASGSFRERTTAVLDAHFEFLQQRPLAFRILALDSRADPEIAKVGHQLRDAASEALGAALSADFDRAGIARGGPARDAKLVLLISAIQGISGWWFDHPEVTRAEIVAATADWLDHGLNGT
ncbi:hypothetical protein BOO86_25565 [Mycobacterium sp. CBMA 234]|nr:hypothetical protein [Mycolicibacterium sp. CBMA 234]